MKCREQIETAKEDRGGPPTPPEDLFRIRLDGLALRDVREVWVESYRFTGEARLDGHLRFWPSIEIGFAVADLMAEIDLEVGGQKRIDDADVEGRGRMRLIDIQRAKAETTWRAISLRTKADAPEVDLALLQQIISGTDPIAPPSMPRIAGRAHLMAEIELENGAAKLLALYLESKQAQLKLIERRLVGHARAELLLLPVSKKALGVKKAHVIVKNVGIENGKERSYGDAELEVNASGQSRLSPSEQKLKLDLTGRSSHSGMLVDLMTTGLPQKIADLLVDDDEPATFSAELVVDEDVARLESFSAKADSLLVEGRMRLSPDPGGQMTIDYHGIEITRPL